MSDLFDETGDEFGETAPVATGGRRKGRNAENNETKRPPVSDLTFGLWVLAALLAFLLFVLWFFGYIYGA